MPELYARTMGGTLVHLYVQDGQLFEAVAEPYPFDPPAANHGKVPAFAEDTYLVSWATIRQYKIDLVATAEAEASRMGQAAGTAAADWVFDGNTASEEYGRVLNGIEDGDPAVMDAFTEPTLSGDGMTSAKLLNCLDLPPAISDEEAARICDAWEAGASEGFWHRLEKICREHFDGSEG